MSRYPRQPWGAGPGLRQRYELRNLERAQDRARWPKPKRQPFYEDPVNMLLIGVFIVACVIALIAKLISLL